MRGELRTAGGAARESWRQMIQAHEAPRAHLSNAEKPRPPREQLELLGRKLFSLLFSRQVRSLYETARRARQVELVFTSLVLVRAATQEARIAVAKNSETTAVEWAIPVLYAHYPAQRLCAR